MLRLFVVLAIVIFLCFILYYFRKHYRNSFKPDRRFSSGGRSFVNPLLLGESPESLFARAEDFFSRGLHREAWAACLAGCIGAYSSYRSVSFPLDATEYDCLALVREALPGEDESFALLVQSWILFAYGGRAPTQGAFEQALACGRSIQEGAPGEA